MRDTFDTRHWLLLFALSASCADLPPWVAPVVVAAPAPNPAPCACSTLSPEEPTMAAEHGVASLGKGGAARQYSLPSYDARTVGASL